MRGWMLSRYDGSRGKDGGGERGDRREARPKKGIQALAGWLAQTSMGKVGDLYM